MPDPDLERVLALHSSISELVESIDPQLCWTLQGLGAISLLEARLAALTGDETWNRLSHAHLVRAFEELSESPFYSIGLHDGVSGIGWVAQVVNRRLAPADRFDVSDVDDLVQEYLSSAASWDGNYDLVSGATGCAVYALEHPDPQRRTAMLDAYVRLLSSRAEQGRQGLCWKTPASVLPEWQRRLYPDGHVNLGLAHGIPAVAAMLARMAIAGCASPEAERLLKGSVAECLGELRIDHSADRETIGYVRGDEAMSRCAWCYGEPGMAVALGTAGKALGDRRLRDRARTLFRSSFWRADAASRELHDIGLCHGWTGIPTISAYLEGLDADGSSAPDPVQEQSIQTIRMVCDAALAEGELPAFEQEAHFATASDPTFLGGALGVAHALLDTAFPDGKCADLPWADCVLM